MKTPIKSSHLQIVSSSHHLITSSSHHLIILSLFLFFSIGNVNAAYLKDIPMTVMQPNGDTLHCYASGDEFFNYLHDKDGFTIIQNREGYYVYAIYDGDNIIPSQFVAGSVNPSAKNLQPNVRISNEQYQARRAAWFNFEDIPRDRTPGRNHGTLNNLVVFIRFSDETEITTPLSTVDNMFNNQTPGYNSMINYFRTTSYGHLNVPSSFYPIPEGDLILSYQDIYPRSYYQPDSVSIDGYYDYWERTEREHQLLKRAIEYVAGMVPPNLNIDYDNDGYVDNVCFVIKGNVNAWSSLLWPHRWALWTEDAYIHGKQVWDYNFMLEGASGYFNTAVLSHEMQHTLSFPDLYHYNEDSRYLRPVANWDIMESNPNPPQQSGAYMKWKYGNWLNEPTIIQPGKYTLNSVGSGTGFVSYKIPSSNYNQFFVLEFRNITDFFENFGSNYGTGLLIYRIDTRWNGNAQHDGDTTFDEVYIFRPDGNSPTENGNIHLANFGTDGRTTFDATSNPIPFLTNGNFVNNLSITDITINGDKVSFTYNHGTTQFYGVAFHPNGGEGVMLPQMFEAEVAQSLRYNTFSLEGKTFLGWARTPDGEVEYTNNQSVVIDDDMVLYAKWNFSYTITASVLLALCGDNGCGTIDPEGEVEVLENTNQTFIIERCEGTDSFISVIIIDGIELYPQNEEEKHRMEYTFENVTANHTIGAHFVCLGISEHKKTNISFSIQPNPATQSVEITLSPSELIYDGVIAKIYDAQGLLLKTISLSAEKTQIDVSNLAKGFYIVKIGNEAKKLIIK